MSQVGSRVVAKNTHAASSSEVVFLCWEDHRRLGDLYSAEPTQRRQAFPPRDLYYKQGDGHGTVWCPPGLLRWDPHAQSPFSLLPREDK